MNTPRITQVVGRSHTAQARADHLDQALGGTTVRLGAATQELPAAWAESDLIISHLALGATTRIIAPLLADKKTDPGVVVVDEAGRFVVPLVGGHAGGANDLARQVADIIGGTAVLTTATDALGVPALDTLGWPYHGDVAAVTRAILDGRPVRVVREHRCPLPPLPANVAESPADDPVARLVVTIRDADSVLGDVDADTGTTLPTVVLHPPALVIGLGCNSGTDVDHLDRLIHDTLRDADLAVDAVSAFTTIDLKAGELGLVQLSARHRHPLVPYPAEQLADQNVPTPSAVVAGHVGSPSVSEASVLAHGADLVVPKHKTSDATCAIGVLPARGRLTVVGLGPGARDLLTPRAVRAIQDATYVVGYAPYVRQIRDLVRPGVQIYASKMGTEQERTAAAIARARLGEAVVLVCSGDPAVYAMASPVLEQGTDGIDVVIVPGVTASLAASAILGAPLGHDHALISLSDLHTTWDAIERRVHAAAQGDFVTALYNPRSRTRTWQLPRVLEIMAEHRPATTPIAVVTQAERPRQRVVVSTLGEFDPKIVDMHSLVIIGSSTTTVVTSGGGEHKLVTPRDYSWMPTPPEETATKETHP
ncbi:Siroheme synthase [Austwickia sp. TVS 96-490-7B]|uniref:precorrin-3B C(17)-methyltransferase n=1 Tax=Austwickia sp. TVS 96-490-7B TaxID=2830843 RepID=UPI001C56350A|nr:precorrin-3B C(17)-methyltransferase [Austwickia sp. TVS 96-490-7B]MBW3084979.1 Siroheme synthase [Austwickia sp. TVS 96-490-7B]